MPLAFTPPVAFPHLLRAVKKVMSPCIAFDSIMSSNTEPKTNPVDRANKY